ncbi:MAG: NADH-quinone oxidoreductase subunit 5 family protein [Nocardioidaceae bacterium]
MSALLLMLVAVPFGAAALVLGVGHRSDAVSKGIALGGSALGLALAVGVAVQHLDGAAAYGRVFTGSGVPRIELALRVDQLSALMLLLVGVVAFLVQLYSLGYLASDPRYPSYAALVSVFTGAMTTVVLADDLWVLLVGWELMGACSYFLIAHHWELADARGGAVKAFLMTRTADLGLLFGVFVLGHEFGSYRISTILGRIVAETPARDSLWLPALLLTIAVIGKSAQFPLHTWLPDAMPGPTPISALIHAATMVAAGVFLVARMYPLFLNATSVLTLLAAVAAVTMLIGAVYALFTHDLKRVLAWSTVSQLAYMFGALAVGAYAAGVFHLLAHGAFKALLFLSAGSVVHAVGGSTSMRRMGGLRDKLPDTFVTMTIGFGALAGVVPFVGFFTKDAVVTAAYDEATSGNLVWPWVAWLLLASTVLTAMLTVAYSLRAWLMVFFGAPAPEAVEPHEPPWTMRLPLYVLAVPTLVGGLVVAYPAALLGQAFDVELFHTTTAVLMTVLVVATAALVLWTWRRHEGRDLWAERRLPHPPVDVVYDVALVRPVRALSRIVKAGDRDVIDAYANGAGWSAGALGRLVRLAQNGNVQAYLMVVVVGAAAIAVVAGVMA